MVYGKRLALAAATILAVGSLWMSGCSSSSNASLPIADQTVANLVSGNSSFNNGSLSSLVALSSPAIRTDLGTNGQKPLTIVITCSDSRVPPEIIFNKGLGELFVIRVAGNVLDKQQLGSIEYAIEHLKTPVVIVMLGHTKCGAVSSTVAAVKAGTAIDPAENLGSILAAIQPAVTSAKKLNPVSDADWTDKAVEKNVAFMSSYMLLHSQIIRDAVDGDSAAFPPIYSSVKLVKYKYDITDGSLKSL
jgi:carbonic anhydrase